MTHDDRATKALRSLTRAWAAVLSNRSRDAVGDLSRALDELEADVTFARCNGDVLDLIGELCKQLRSAAEIADRVAALQLRALGRCK